MSFVRPCLRERDTATNLEFDKKGETDEGISVSVSEVEMTEILQETKSTYWSEYSSVSPDELGYNKTAFVMQILLQSGRQNLRNWIRLHRPIWLHIIDILVLKYVINFVLLLAAVCVVFVTSIDVF